MEPEPTVTRPRHLALVGLMGAGKTAVGASVAADLGRRHVDLDRAVTQLAGRSVGVIFHESGEQAFRDLEEQALGLQMDAVDPVVLSTGGGVLGRETNRDALARGATVVWLRAAPETLADPGGRPVEPTPAGRRRSGRGAATPGHRADPGLRGGGRPGGRYRRAGRLDGRRLGAGRLAGY